MRFTTTDDAAEAQYRPLTSPVWAYVMMFPVSLGAIFASIIAGAFVSDDVPVFSYLWFVIGIVFLALWIYKFGWNLSTRLRIRVEHGSVSIGPFSEIPIHNVTRLHCLDDDFRPRNDTSESTFRRRKYTLYLIDHDGREQVVELPRIRPTDDGKQLGKWLEEQLML